MSQSELENYLVVLGRMLRLSRARQGAIAQELRDHLQERLAELTGQGVSQEEAILRALEEFGDAATLAAQFREIARNQHRRWVMRCTMGSIVGVIAAAMVALAVWPGTSLPVAGRLAIAGNPKDVKSASNASAMTAALEDSQRNAAVAAKLAKRVPVEFEEAPIKVVFLYVQEAAGVDLAVKWRKLEEAGVEQDKPVTLKLKEAPADMVLEMVLDQVADGLGSAIQKGIVVVSTKDDLAAKKVLAVYPVRDLLGDKQDEAAEKLVKALQGTVAPETWTEVGGQGSMAAFNGMLIVNQTAEIQGELDKAIRMLREASETPGGKK